MEEWIVVGTIFKKHGLRGDVKVYPMTDSPERFLDLGEVVLEDPRGERHELTIDGVRFQQDRVILHFQGKDSLAEIEPFIKSKILVHRSQAVPLPEGRYYYADIIGLPVFADDGKYLGTVDEIMETGSNDVYVVRDEDHEILIPAIRDVIREVDLEGRRMTVHIMEGLLE